MKTLICTSPGNLEYREAAKPELKKNQAILKIKRIGICGTDLHAYEGTQPYFTYPRILGHEIAAEMVEIDGSTDIKHGEIITIIPYFYCGKCIACREGKSNCCENIKVAGVHIDGGMVEYLSVPTYSLVQGNGLPPDSLALIEPLSIGAHAVRRADIKPGEFVLVVGAGPIGLGIMEFAKIAGARVIALDINESRLNFCKEKLQIPFIVNSAHSHEVVGAIKEITNGEMPTAVFDATGNLQAINTGFTYMSHGGRYILVGLQKGEISFSHPEFHKREATLMSSRNATREDFENVISALKKGWIQPASWITHRVRFDQVKNKFENLLNPANNVIKAIVEIN